MWRGTIPFSFTGLNIILKKKCLKLIWLSMSLHIFWKISRSHPWKIYEEKALQKTEKSSQTTTSRRDMWQDLQTLENIL
jgi:hypothetical protein